MTVGDQAYFDLLIIGGGVNGAGIARDAVGRGFSVCLCESGDFGSGTSSASTKLFHGGLRYLEYLEFRLVREALIERETLLRAMPHISWPMRFVLPYHAGMRFESQSPTSRLLALTMPWQRGARPAWLIRLGLFLYDHLGGRKILPGTQTIDLTADEAGRPLKPIFEKAFEYSDCWVEDSRLVVLNLRDAQSRGAQINPRTKVARAVYENGKWRVTLAGRGGTARQVTAKLVVNAAGPWVDAVLTTVFGRNEVNNVRLVRGSHIVIKRKFHHDRAYFFQNADGRIIFAIPYEGDYTLIGTTDADHENINESPQITQEETDYLCEMASEYFLQPVTADDIVWTYSGVRPLFDDGESQAQAATRDYVIRADPQLGNGTLVNIFGGKITTYRKLAEQVMREIETRLGKRGAAWTAGAPLPGGDFPVDGFDALVEDYSRAYPFMERRLLRRLARAYGTETPQLLGQRTTIAQLGTCFGADLYEAELEWLVEKEWASSAQDALFRRTRLGIRLSPDEIDAVEKWMRNRIREPV